MGAIADDMIAAGAPPGIYAIYSKVGDPWCDGHTTDGLRDDIYGKMYCVGSTLRAKYVGPPGTEAKTIGNIGSSAGSRLSIKSWRGDENGEEQILDADGSKRSIINPIGLVTITQPDTYTPPADDSVRKKILNAGGWPGTYIGIKSDQDHPDLPATGTWPRTKAESDGSLSVFPDSKTKWIRVAPVDGSALIDKDTDTARVSWYQTYAADGSALQGRTNIDLGGTRKSWGLGTVTIEPYSPTTPTKLPITFINKNSEDLADALDEVGRTFRNMGGQMRGSLLIPSPAELYVSPTGNANAAGTADSRMSLLGALTKFNCMAIPYGQSAIIRLAAGTYNVGDLDLPTILGALRIIGDPAAVDSYVITGALSHPSIGTISFEGVSIDATGSSKNYAVRSACPGSMIQFTGSANKVAAKAGQCHIKSDTRGYVQVSSSDGLTLRVTASGGNVAQALFADNGGQITIAGTLGWGASPNFTECRYKVHREGVVQLAGATLNGASTAAANVAKTAGGRAYDTAGTAL